VVVSVKPNDGVPGHFLEDWLARNQAGVDHRSTEGSARMTGGNVKPLHFLRACSKHQLLESHGVKKAFPRPIEVQNSEGK